jgi:hypothetical protein
VNVLREMFSLLAEGPESAVRVRQLARNYAAVVDLNRRDANGRLVSDFFFRVHKRWSWCGV